MWEQTKPWIVAGVASASAAMPTTQSSWPPAAAVAAKWLSDLSLQPLAMGSVSLEPRWPALGAFGVSAALATLYSGYATYASSFLPRGRRQVSS